MNRSSGARDSSSAPKMLATVMAFLGGLFLCDAVIMAALEVLGIQGRWIIVLNPLLLAMVAAPFLYWLIVPPAHRRATQTVRQESEERYRQLFEAESDAIVLIDNASGRILEANNAASVMYGYTREELIEKTNADLSAEPEQTRQVTTETAVIPDAVVTVPLRRHRKRDGTVFTVEITGRFFRYQGRSVHIAAIRDITPRVQAEQALRENERQYRTLFNLSPAGILIEDAEGRVLDANPAVCRFLGARREDLVGAHISQFTQDPPQIIRSRIEQILAGGTFNHEVTNRRSDGSLCQMELRETAIQLPDGSPAVMVVSNDVTARRQLEEQLRQAQKMEAVGQLAGGVAHDFNNLLQVINGYAEVGLQQIPPAHSIHALLDGIGKAGERAASLVSQLLAFSRRQILNPQPLDLNEVIAALLRMLRRVLGEHVRIEFMPGQGVGTVRADRAQIEQVLINLAINARDAMPGGGDLTITTRDARLDETFCASRPWARPGRFASIRVSDTGHGMSAETLARVFEPFFTTKELGKGVGLGLATVYGVVKQHDGLIDVQSQPERGTAFEICLPVSEGGAPVSEAPSEPALIGGSETILLAEDDAMARDLIRTVLESAGYDVRVAQDGKEALRLCEEINGAADLALLDVVMPGLGGRPVHDYLKEHHPRTRVLFISGYSAQALPADFADGDGCEFIQKPVQPARLLQKVRQMLDRPRSGAQ